MIEPAAYWRDSKDWKNWIGRRGRVVVTTTVRVAPPGFEWLAPYSFVIAEFNGERRSFMAIGQEALQAGDEVECVLRKFRQPDETGVIPYGIKVRKV